MSSIEEYSCAGRKEERDLLGPIRQTITGEDDASLPWRHSDVLDRSKPTSLVASR